MSKIYVPSQYLNKSCYIINNDYIRVYETTYNNNSNTVYDIYFKNDYMVKRHNANYSSNTVCDNINSYVDDIYYRYDFDKIIIIFISLVFVCFVFPLKILFRFFRRFN